LNLHKALDIKETFWCEKAKINWYLEGDRNTRYFHKVSRIQNSTKTISYLKDGDNMLQEPEHIAEHITNHFKNIL